MKFDHNFTQTIATPTGRTYAADGWQAQLDFLSGSCLRVALYRNADDLLPTFNIDPDNASIGPGPSATEYRGFSAGSAHSHGDR